MKNSNITIEGINSRAVARAINRGFKVVVGFAEDFVIVNLQHPNAIVSIIGDHVDVQMGDEIKRFEGKRSVHDAIDYAIEQAGG